MSEPYNLQIEGLNTWLKTATKDLIPQARQKIRLEIEAHFADSVGSHTTEGQAAEPACRIALAELGDPKLAARQFRRAYLTVTEGNGIESALKVAASAWWVRLNAFLCVIFLGMVSYGAQRKWLPCVSVAVLGAFLSAALGILPQLVRSRLAGNDLSSSSIQLVIISELAASVAQMAGSMIGVTLGWFSIIIVLAVVLKMWVTITVCRKLGRFNYAWKIPA